MLRAVQDAADRDEATASGAEKAAGLVLAGGGARGAYEFGALSVLLPALEAHGVSLSTLAGTSVGAINAAHVASTAHLPAARAAEHGLEVWREISKGEVIRPIIARQAPLTALRYAGEILSVPGVRLDSLLDPAPLERNLESWIDWDALRSNLGFSAPGALAVVATDAASGRTVAFVEGSELPPSGSHTLDYARARITARHLRASAAIPILFPPVQLDSAAGRPGWYVDGGTRLNTPIKPALDLGAERLVIVATGAGERRRYHDGDDGPPDFGDGALHLLEGALVDPLLEDLHRLGKINAFLEAVPDHHVERFRVAREQRPYRRVPFILVAPQRADAIGELASAVFADRYRGFRGMRSPDLRLLNRLIGGDSATHGELLSYLFFDPVFMRELIEMGQRDARRTLASDRGLPWRWE